jgi:pimeloyl-ACP methyl ester carboxylesterase
MKKTLLFLHGWASNPSIWEKQVENFKDCDILTPDTSLYESLDEMAKNIYPLCKNAKNLIIIAWSMGWLAVLKVLEYSGLDIKALVSICGTAKFISGDYIKDGIKASELRALRMGLKKDFVATLDNFYAQHRIPLDAGSLAKKKDLCLKQLDILEKEDLRKNLPLIKCPALFMTGRDDTLCPVSVLEYMSSRVKGSQAKIIEGAGHAPFVKKEVNYFIEEFIK